MVPVVYDIFSSVAEHEHTCFWIDKINRTEKVCHLEELYRNPLFFVLNLFLQFLMWAWAGQQMQATHFGVDHKS